MLLLKVSQKYSLTLRDMNAISDEHKRFLYCTSLSAKEVLFSTRPLQSA